ncbi:MAG: zinc metallopeptidase [Phaeodactylibacter sp.]|nr:zinc metallopeptidase [Phaeodactylibacter sp.]MCB9297851.1 zinc metallopeptidase [Lewinellaceae bacterium]
MGAYYGYFIIGGILSVVGMVISQRLKSKFNKYSNVPIRSGLSGKEVAEQMLRHFGISDVKVVEGQGVLTDHYNPATRTVSLSEGVFRGRNIAAAAVAAHECGHAVQHAEAYAPLKMRSALVPIVNLSAMAQQWLLILAFMTLSTMPSLMLITIIAFAVTTLFSFITLPVEFDASRRALVWLDNSGVARGQEYDGAKDALWWAAMTYVAAALSALVMVLYLIMQYNRSR